MSIYICELPPAQQKYIAHKLVLLYGSENLLGFSVEYLLKSAGDLEVIRIADDRSLGFLLQELENINPDIIILSQIDLGNKDEIAYLLMRSKQTVKILIVNHQNNLVEIFTKQQVMIGEGTDLLSIVGGCPHVPGCEKNYWS
jgi:hypothetical protein